MFRETDIFNKVFNATALALAILCFSLSINHSYAQNVQTDTIDTASEQTEKKDSPAPGVKDYQQFLDSEIARKNSKNLEIVDLGKMNEQDKRNFFIAMMEKGITPKFSTEADKEAYNRAKSDFNAIVEAADNAQIDTSRDGRYNVSPKDLAQNRVDEIMGKSAGSGVIGSLLGNKDASQYTGIRDYVSWSKDFEQNLDFNFEANITNTADIGVAEMDSNIKNKLQEMNKKLDAMVDAGYITREQAEQEASRIRGKLQSRMEKYADDINNSDLSDEEKRKKILEVTEDVNSAQQEIGLCAKSCLPYCYYKEIKDKCPFCSLFRVAFNVSSQMAYLSLDVFSGTFVKVTIIGFAIWIALQVLSFVSTISMVNFKNFIQPLLTQGFVVAVAVIILQNGAMDFFNLALEPIYNTGMKIAQKTISIDDVAKAKQAEKDGKDISDVKTACVDDPAILSAKDGGALPTSMGNSIICSMKLVYNRAAKIKALGSASICYSWEKRAFIIPHIGYLMTGLGLWVGAMLMILGVPFMMIDSVLQLAVAAALLPLAIAAYAFKATRKHTKSVWETFLNSMFSFIFVSLIALMLTVAFEQILIDSTQGSLDTLLSQQAKEADMEKILKDIPWWGSSFIKVVFVTILAWAMLREALDFASDFSSTMSKTNLGSQIATMGGSAVKGMAVKATSSTVEAGWQVAKDAGGSAYRGARNVGRRGLMAFQGRNIRNNAANVQTNKQTGAKTYTDAKGNKATYGSDGTMESVTRVKQSTNMITGRTTTAYKTKTRDVSITSMDIKNRNGTVIGHREIIRHNSSRFSELQNANGTINNGTIDAILANTPPEAQDKVKVAIAKEIIGQRHKNLGMNMRKDDYTEQQILTDDAGRFIGFSEMHSDGSKTIVKLKTGENGRMLTELTSIDKKGRGQSLRTDGIINSRRRFNTKDGTANGKIDEDSYKTIYSVAGRYRGANPKNPEFKKLLEEEGMFEDEEIEAAFEAADSNDLNMHQFRN